MQTSDRVSSSVDSHRAVGHGTRIPTDMTYLVLVKLATWWSGPGLQVC